MTKQVLILAYILFVLLLSGMARAQIPAPTLGHGLLRQAAVVPESGILNVQGSLANPCESKPQMMVLASRGEELLLDVVTFTSQRSGCSDVQGKHFEISYDLKELELTPNKVYTLTFANSPITIKYNALKQLEGFKYYRVNRQSFNGTLVELSAAEAAQVGYPQSTLALHDGKQSVPVYSPDLDLEKYKNGAVSLLGYPVGIASLNDGGHEDPALSSSVGKIVDQIIVPISVSRVEP